MGKKSGSGSGMNNLDHISELRKFGLVEIFKFFDADPGLGMEKNFLVPKILSYLHIQSLDCVKKTRRRMSHA
jgi:hypothetical protein